MNNRPRPSLSRKQRACTTKIRFDSPGEAELAALTRMALNATAPLSVYECRFCVGYHLTSSTVVSDSTVDVETPLTQVSIFAAISHEMGRTGFKQRRRKWLRRERVREAQRRRRNRETRKFYERTQPPRLSTPAEVDAFFAAHLRPA
jgi:hypothetical protein